MVNNSRSVVPLFLLFIAALCSGASVLKKSYHLDDAMMNWTEARQFCQRNFRGLATLRTAEERHELAMKPGIDHVWIGLYRDPGSSEWKWTAASEGNDSAEDVPQSGVQANKCAKVDSDGKLSNNNTCSEKHYFYCSKLFWLRYYEMNKTWYEAAQFCQERWASLATVTQKNAHLFDKGGWIGLYQESNKIWKWSETFSYMDRAAEQPDNEDCGSFGLHTLRFYSTACSEDLKFACHSDNLVLVKENKTWEEALEHCRAITSHQYPKHMSDLVSLQSDDLIYARMMIQEATTNEVWTGLRLLAGKWLWVNGKWLHSWNQLHCPAQQQHCGVLSKDGKGHWETKDCEERRNFLCYKKRIMS